MAWSVGWGRVECEVEWGAGVWRSGVEVISTFNEIRAHSRDGYYFVNDIKIGL